MTIKSLTPHFVEHFPEQLEAGALYLAMEFSTAAHLCACGCGLKVITPFSPTDWQMAFDGETVSLKPSIGNWTFPCRSHYWIRGCRIEWSGDMSDEAIKQGRLRDLQAKARYETSNAGNGQLPSAATPQPVPHEKRAPGGNKAHPQGLISRIKSWLGIQ
jgi:hypothetical protein